MTKGKYVFLTLAVVLIVFAVWLAMFFFASVTTVAEESDIYLFMYEYSVDDAAFTTPSDRDYYNRNRGRLISSEEFSSYGVQTVSSWQTMTYGGGLIDGDLLLTVDGEERALTSQDSLTFKFFDDGSQYVPASVEKVLEENYGKSCTAGGGFSQSGGAEMYISENLLEKLGIEVSSAIGKKVSLSVTPNTQTGIYIIDDDTDKWNAPSGVIAQERVDIFREFTIVGVICGEYYEINDLTGRDADIWMKGEVLEDENGESLMPEFVADGRKVTATYASADYAEYSAQVTSAGKFFPFFCAGVPYEYNGPSGNNIAAAKRAFAEYDGYSSSAAAAKAYDESAKTNFNFFHAPYSGEFGSYSVVRTACISLIAVSAVLGAVFLALCVAGEYKEEERAAVKKYLMAFAIAVGISFVIALICAFMVASAANIAYISIAYAAGEFVAALALAAIAAAAVIAITRAAKRKKA